MTIVKRDAGGGGGGRGIERAPEFIFRKTPAVSPGKTAAYDI